MVKKITVIGTDSTHCVAFARLLNENPNSQWEISYALRDTRSKLALSIDRYKNIETQMRELTIEIFDHLSSQLVSSTDAFIIASVDASLHLEQFKKLVKYGKPIFIDKPIAYSKNEMEKIFELSNKHQIEVMTSSSLRFSESILKAQEQIKQLQEPVSKIVLKGPMSVEPGIPGMFWYGIHLIETLLTLLPQEYEILSVNENEELLEIYCRSGDARIEFKGDLTGHGNFEGMIQTHSQVIYFNQELDSNPLYTYLVTEMLEFFETGHSPVSQEQTKAVISLVERINDKGGWH